MNLTEQTRADATIRVRLSPTDAGGRRTGLPAKRFRCPVWFDERRELAFDCMLLLDAADTDAPLEPGGPSFVVPVKFLSPDLVAPFLRPGARFALWDGKKIGEGEVLEVF